MDVRTPSEANEAEKAIHIGPITFILIHADWCGHCQTYKPLWEELENMPDRKANVLRVHHDMMEKIPSIMNAKIQGYPSVIKVKPDGSIEKYKVPDSSEVTNAMPNMRDMEAMKKEIMNADSVLPAALTRGKQSGGALSAVSSAFLGAFQKVGPAALLLAAHESLPKSKTYKSPKRASRRASTRKNRQRRSSRKN
jgi:thiol-disulfide isomerase/thioredoxin